MRLLAFVTALLLCSIWDVCQSHQTRAYRAIKDSDNLPVSELQALLDLFSATNGQNWIWRNESFGMRWNFTDNANPCEDDWQGVNCSMQSEFHVQSIDLNGYGLVGTIPSSIGNFSALQYLLLNDNSLFNKIPETLGNLSHMIELNLNRNKLNGTMPVSVGKMQQLQLLNVGQNRMHGPLPASLCDLPNLRDFNLSSNKFMGVIPNCIDGLQGLQVLNVSINRLVGTLPAALGSQSHLVAIDVHKNHLTGTIPYEISNLANLSFLLLGDNLFEGTLPQEWSKLSNLKQLSVRHNTFNGTIPVFFGDFSQLQILYLQHNELTGTLPSSLGQLRELKQLIVYVNHLNGTLPVELQHLTKLWFLDVGDNLLEGTIPPEYGNLTKLQYLYLNINLLFGTIPQSLGNLLDLKYLFLSENNLTGTIPSSSSNLTQLTEIVLYINEITGTVPEGWSNLRALAYLDIGHNRLQGTIPNFLGNLSRLQFLYINRNRFSGTIPRSLGQLSQLQELLLQSNALGGSIPAELSHLYNLTVIALEYNALSGTLDSVFDSASQLALNTIKVNNNRLTGTLPDELFLLKNLKVLIAGSNCFEGSVPQSVCNAPHLRTLSLDGLSSAKYCRSTLLPGITTSYMNRGVFSGNLKSCLLQMPTLSSLHLSGIDITETLPDVNISTVLVDLCLSHNRLTGPIPQQYQQKVWFRLDLSFNRLSGTLRSDFASGIYELNDDYVVAINITHGRNEDFSLLLENNRLSGDIPESIVNMQNISILGSNLFSCNLFHTDLPSHDHGVDKYQCGSETFDVPYYVWLACLALCVVAAVLTWHLRMHIECFLQVNSVAAICIVWLKAAAGSLPNQGENESLPNIAIASHLCLLLCRTALCCLLFIMLLLLPVFSILSVYSGTMTHQYAYASSAAFLSGNLPTALELVLLPSLLLLFVTLFMRQIAILKENARTSRLYSRTSRSISRSDIPKSASYAWLRNTLVYTLFGATNTTIVVGANVAYVYVAIYESADFQVAAQISLAVFKVIWNGAGSAYLLILSAQYIALYDGQEMLALEAQLVMLQIFMALFNNIAIPCIVVAIVSPSCFYNVFVPPPTVSTLYTYVLCTSFHLGECATFDRVRSNSVYEPSFNYSYQCSSSIITYYAPAFVIMCIIVTMFIPCVEFVAVRLLCLAEPKSLLYRTLYNIVPPILKPIDRNKPAKTHKRYLSIHRLLVILTNYLGLLLTFGAVFPPLAAALTVTLVAVVYFSKIKLGRFLCRAAELSQHSYIDSVEKECQKAGTVEVLRKSMWLLVFFASLFYTMFIFDTLGDKESLVGAYWVLIVVPLMPVLIYAVHKFSIARVQSPPAALSDGDVELNSNKESAEEPATEAASPSTEIISAMHDRKL